MEQNTVKQMDDLYQRSLLRRNADKLFLSEIFEIAKSADKKTKLKLTVAAYRWIRPRGKR